MDKEVALLLQSMDKTMQDIKNIMKEVGDHIKSINDDNIFHHNKFEQQQQTMMQKMEVLTGKYWWLIIFLIMALLFVMGYKEITNFSILP